METSRDRHITNTTNDIVSFGRLAKLVVSILDESVFRSSVGKPISKGCMMFWDVQSQAVAAKSAETHLGTMGRYVESSNDKFFNVRLYSHQAGIFWYGDINWPTEKSLLEKVASELKETVFVVPEADSSDARPFSRQAIAQTEV